MQPGSWRRRVTHRADFAATGLGAHTDIELQGTSLGAVYLPGGNSASAAIRTRVFS